ncbi:hypothetical protein HNR74_003433 [Flammeovirga kamogawensis]|nr:hypothetical protein [Flammeovirga kamogawensis]
MIDGNMIDNTPTVNNSKIEGALAFETFSTMSINILHISLVKICFINMKKKVKYSRINWLR